MDLGVLQQAIMCLFDPQTSQEAKQGAERYCSQVRQSDRLWEVAWSLFVDASNKHEIRFWALSELAQYLKEPSRYSSLAEDARIIVRRSLIRQLREIGAQDPPFIRNKFATVLVLVIKTDYPERWPTVFDEIFESLNQGTDVIDLFLRILNIIDEEIVQFHIDRTPSEVAHNTLIKDTMRMGVLANISSAVFQLLVTYHSALPELAAASLKTFQKYIGWIEIHLTANDRMIPLFFSFLNNPVLQEPACECLYELITKGTDARTKIALLEGLRLDTTLRPYLMGDNYDFHEKVGSVIIAACQELMEICIGFDKQDPVATGNAAHGYKMVCDYLPMVYAIMESESDDVSEISVSFVVELVQYFKKNPIGDSEINVIERLFNILAKKMRYDNEYNFDAPEESEEQFDEFRKTMSSIFKNLCRLAPANGIRFIGQILSSTISSPSVQFQDLEVGLFLLYQFGEGLPEDVLKPDGGLAPIMNMISSSNVSSYPHVAVAEMYFENVSRYSKFYLNHPHHIPNVLTSFLDTRGIRHPSVQVRSRACLLFARFLKALKTVLHPYMDGMLSNLRECLLIQPGMPNPSRLSNEDQAQVYQAVGLMIGSDSVTPEVQEQYLEAIISPIMSQIKQISVMELPSHQTPEALMCAQHVSHLTNSLGLFSKGFARTVVQTRPSIISFFKNVTAGAIELIPIFKPFPETQGKIIFFIHRMADVLGEEIAPFIQKLLPVMFECEMSVFAEIIRLFNQLLGKWKDRIVAFIDEIYLPALSRLIAAQQNAPSLLQNTETERERLENRRLMFQFIQAVTLNASDVLISSRNSPQLPGILSLMLQSLVEEREMPIRKICCFTLNKMIEEWGRSTDKFPGFGPYIFEAIIPAIFSCPVNPNFNLGDATAIGIIGELVTIQLTISSQYGESYVAYLRTNLFPRLSLSQSDIDGYFRSLGVVDQTGLKTFMKNMAALRNR